MKIAKEMNTKQNKEILGETSIEISVIEFLSWIIINERYDAYRDNQLPIGPYINCQWSCYRAPHFVQNSLFQASWAT